MESSGLRKAIQRRRKRHMEYRLNMFYFLPAPEWLVCTHLPSDARWQLLSSPAPNEKQTTSTNGFEQSPTWKRPDAPLAEPLRVEQFERIPKLYYHFFVHELDFAPADRSTAVIRVPMRAHVSSEPRAPSPSSPAAHAAHSEGATHVEGSPVPVRVPTPTPDSGASRPVVVVRLSIPKRKRMSFKAELSATDREPQVDAAKLSACGTNARTHVRYDVRVLVCTPNQV